MQYAIESTKKGTLVKVKGDIDAASGATLTTLAGKLAAAAAPIAFDLSRVTWINSTGARHWVTFMQAAVTPKTGGFEFVSCSVHFMDYVNLVK